MAENEVRIDVVCDNEKKVVGAIDVPAGKVGGKGFLLSSRVVWAGFRPATEDYRLPSKMQGDGHVLRCPRCQGMLCIQGQTKTADKDVPAVERDAARRRSVDLAKNKGEVHQHLASPGIDQNTMPITLGKTLVEAKG